MIKLLEFVPGHKADFERLNVGWISRFFQLEEEDRKVLGDPEQYILGTGGAILMAEKDGDIVGTCALIRKDVGVYELAKMAVDPSSQGHGIGKLLGIEIVARARQLGAHTLYLETNKQLKPAISLYKKLGFETVEGYCTPYARCDLHMEMKF